MNTTGSVTIEDGNPGVPGDFNPRRKVVVTISYHTEDGDGSDGQSFLDRAANAANAKVDELLGRKSAKQPVKVDPTGGTPPTETASKPKKKAAKEAATELSDKEKLAVAAGVLATDTPAKVVEKLAEPEADSLDDLLGEQAPVPITDAELAKAAQNKNGQMKASDPNFSVKIRALVVEYAGPPPKKITDVPVAKRQEFLDKLRDLK